MTLSSSFPTSTRFSNRSVCWGRNPAVHTPPSRGPLKTGSAWSTRSFCASQGPSGTVENYERLASISRTGVRQTWAKFKWSVDGSNLDALHIKVDLRGSCFVRSCCMELSLIGSIVGLPQREYLSLSGFVREVGSFPRGLKTLLEYIY